MISTVQTSSSSGGGGDSNIDYDRKHSMKRHHRQSEYKLLLPHSVLIALQQRQQEALLQGAAGVRKERTSTDSEQVGQLSNKTTDTTCYKDRSERYRPQSLATLTQATRFSREEIQRLYRGIKQFCPTGMVDLETFTTIFKTLFPQGDPSDYAALVFSSFDSGRRIGAITFDELVVTLSILFRGTLDEKLAWIFNLYDSNRDGKLTKDELLGVTRCVYRFLGVWTRPIVSIQDFSQHSDKIFNEMDRDGDGIVNARDFAAYCKSTSHILDSILCLDTML